MISDIEINQEGTGIKQQVRTDERIWFLTNDRKLFTQIGTRLLAINCLAPYPTWDLFKPEIGRAYETVRGAIDIQGLARIGLRYVNRIEIASPKVDLEEYFDFRPHLGERLPQDLVSFTTGGLLPFNEGRDLCKIQLTSTVAEKPDTNIFVLDLDYFFLRPKAVAPDQAMEWTEIAHTNIESVFEGCVTDHLREIFKRA